jgi:hypothetical protein
MPSSRSAKVQQHRLAWAPFSREGEAQWFANAIAGSGESAASNSKMPWASSRHHNLLILNRGLELARLA